MYDMSITLTVRTDEQLMASLRQTATADGITLSDLVRRILEDAVAERSLGRLSGHLRGRLELDPTDQGDAWHQQLRERNWRE